MQLRWTISVIVGLLTIYSTARAEPLLDTTALLRNSQARNELMKTDIGAQNANVQVKKLGLTQAGEEKVYDLSAKIFETLSQKSEGDPEKLNTKVQELLRDPASLQQEMTPEQQAEIHNLASP